jgi:hypothetical protein
VRRCAGWLLLMAIHLLVLGCDDTPAPVAEPLRPEVGGERFDPARAGTISGRVVWRGPLPDVAPFRSIPEPLTDRPPPPARIWPNPNAPIINQPTSGVVGAVVWLKEVDPAIARPWDLPAVRVEIKGQQFHVLQGTSDGRTGFVRPHNDTAMVSRDPIFHAVQARGLDSSLSGQSAFFTCMLPDPNQVVSRRMAGPEVVELTSGCGYFWMRAYLFVCPHPYLARTDEQGRFTLPGVPEGKYDIVAWHPNWRVRETLRNTDTMRVQQVQYGAALECKKTIDVEAGRTATVQLFLGGDR